MSRRLIVPMLMAALACAAPAALAFQETKGGVAGPGAAAAPGAPAGPATQLDLSGTGTSIAPPSGTEVRIPGLGKLGVLPKLDFGLELLYGVNDASRFEDPNLKVNPTPDDLGIRGTLKHRF